jgi:hypothetical protein
MAARFFAVAPALVVVGPAAVLCFGLGGALAQAPSPDNGMAEPGTEQPVPGEEAPPAGPSPQVVPMPAPRSWEPRTTAELQALNKIDDRSATLNVPVGQTAQFERLSITVRSCVARVSDQGLDFAAFLQIADSRPGTPGFAGWMLATAPSLSMMQHPAYDVRIVACR